MSPRSSPVPASHTSTLPSPPPAATTVSSLHHATQLAAARLPPVSVATAAPDDALHSRTLPSDNAAATTAQLGLKCTLVMLQEAPVRQAMAVNV
jgi:hypothetical protein